MVSAADPGKVKRCRKYDACPARAVVTDACCEPWSRHPLRPPARRMALPCASKRTHSSDRALRGRAG